MTERDVKEARAEEGKEPTLSLRREQRVNKKCFKTLKKQARLHRQSRRSITMLTCQCGRFEAHVGERSE